MSPLRTIVVVGASLAGLRAAEALRGAGFDGSLTIVGDEPHLPYDRPPLSKQVLAGAWEVDRLGLTDGRTATAGESGDLGLDWRLGARAESLDLAARTVTLGSGERLSFGGLVIATGASPRALPGTEGQGSVHTLRTIDDCLALRADLDRGPRRVVVIGAGFIGAEVAATCRGRGIDVTLLEALPVPMGRVFGPEVGAVFADLHRDHGVDVRLGTGVAGLDGEAQVERVRLLDGGALDADVVVVGIGVVPNCGWLEGSGLSLDNGVLCDETCLAAPRVVAAGDVARWPNRRFGEVMRVEHWENAVTQGEHAGRRLLVDDATAEAYDPVPWFWSDQYDRKIQLAGICGPDDAVEVVDGSLAERRFVAFFGRAGRLVGVLGCNRPRLVMQYRNLVAEGATFDAALAVAKEPS